MRELRLWSQRRSQFRLRRDHVQISLRAIASYVLPSNPGLIPSQLPLIDYFHRGAKSAQNMSMHEAFNTNVSFLFRPIIPIFLTESSPSLRRAVQELLGATAQLEMEPVQSKTVQQSSDYSCPSAFSRESACRSYATATAAIF